MLNDTQERIKATDPKASYIVQAPAGSGKTEILTQRYLRLLCSVSAPEQIIALTFTRKAANEMRERILRALHQANDNLEGTTPHQQQTLTYATEALAKDRAHQWQILQQPGRLRIITIDSLCQTLNQAIPLQDKKIPYAIITDKPQRHYQAAARACFNYAIENTNYHPALKTLLLHVDNRQDILLTLFSKLLAERTQWQSLIYQAKEQDKKTYEEALSWIEQHELNRFQQSLPNRLAQTLVLLIIRLDNIQPNPGSPLRHLTSLSSLDRTLISQVAKVILTSQNTLRKAFDHHVGLKRGECSNEDYNELKSQSKDLLSELEALPDFVNALLRVKNLPPPQYNHEQWEVLQALFSLLPLLAAHLQVVFSEQNEVDFTAVSEQALLALGEDENPTDLALYLDNSIHHLLIDEFQDTSIQQFELLCKLVQGFQPNDGKTLFIVGDPMQSIYRFRQAEVGLFLRAKHHGIGSVKLIPLELLSNFRSTETVVHWVNDHFKTIFPLTDDIESGAITFHPSVHVKPADSGSSVMAFQYKNREQEAEAVVQIIKSELTKHPTDEIAILVRSRLQLTTIVTRLRAHDIPFQGVEIDLLAKLPHLRDLWSLTQALLMPTNRLVWLSLLRSPWCGLALNDLLAIANHNPKQSIFFALSQLETISKLSHEGKIRAHFLYQVLEHALASRYQQPLIAWINTTLKNLHLEHVLTEAQQEDIEQYWLLLERFDQQGQLDDLNEFNLELNKLYSQSVVPSRVKIMTIHKSKGLEFDAVILPGLSSRPTNQDMPMLRWLKLPREQQKALLLLSPMKAAHQEQCLLYDYLGKLDAQKNNYELQRLLYVAVTRAKKRLYLLDYSEKNSQGSFRSLLANQAFISPPEINHLENVSTTLPTLYQLPLAFYQEKPVLKEQLNTSPLIITNTTPRLIGIVAHELLQWICEHHPENQSEIPWGLASHQLISFGFRKDELKAAEDLIKTQLGAFFNDSIGQWIIKAHENEHNEYELLVPHQNTFATKIIDRTFCDKGIRWIIDFKTGHDDTSTETPHRQQLEAYARLFTGTSNEPIHCGLYYLASNRWLDWEYINT